MKSQTLILSLLLTALPAAANTTDSWYGSPNSAVLSGQVPARIANTGPLKKMHWYTLEQTITVHPTDVMAVDGTIDPPQDTKTLVEGTDINIVSYSDDGQTVTIAFNLEGQNTNPQDPLPFQMNVATAEILRGRPTILVFDHRDGPEVAPEYANMDTDKIPAETQEASNGHRHRTQYARNGKARPKVEDKDQGLIARIVRVHGKDGMTMCLADVRVNAENFCHQTMPGIEAAADAYDVYHDAGWMPVDFKPDIVPVCTACFWGGGRTDCDHGACGHASLKVLDKKWVGAGIFEEPALPDKNGCETTVRRNKRRHKTTSKTVCRVPYELKGCLAAPGTNPSPEVALPKPDSTPTSEMAEGPSGT